MVISWLHYIIIILCSGAVSYISSPFGKPKRSVLLSSVRCAGNETRLIDCPANKLSFEIGKTLLPHVNVAGVACKIPLTCSKVTVCPTSTPPVPSQQTECATYLYTLIGVCVLFAVMTAILVVG